MENIAHRSWLRLLWIFLSASLFVFSSMAHGDDHPECSFTLENEDEDIVGQFVILSCQINNETQNGFNESSITNWYRVESDQTEIVEFDRWFMSNQDNGVPFVCAEEGMEELDVYCVVTPLEILPTVNVKRSVLHSDGTAIFVCIADGIPSIAKYRWFIDDNDISMYNPINTSLNERDDKKNKNDQRGVKMYSDTIMEVVGLSYKDRGMLVTCEAETSTGLRANATMSYSIEGVTSPGGVMTSDKVFLFGLIFAGGVPMVFAIVAAACWMVRRDDGVIGRKRSLTVEEEDLSPIANGDSLPRDVASGVTSDMPPNAVLYRTHSVRSTKDKVGPMSQLVLPPIGAESNRISQHIYDEAPHFATSELALSRGKHCVTLPAKTYTSRSSLYRMSADYADVPLHNNTPGNYENFRLKTTSIKNGNPNSTLPAIRI